ncbi:MAG TPA: flagellar basal body L-ring protein FlgH [Candidatus Wallbacteria bacterium]|nr:flagellar basal body L-ring protein FlgH [Candidatus Wallbacteria bacterium]
MYRSTFKRFLILSVVSFLLIGCAAAELKAESLWREAEEESAGQSIFSETKGHKIGDIITILIIENSTAVQKATTQNKKSSTVGAKAGTGPLSFIPNISSSTSGDFSGDGSTTRSGTITAKISARVTKIYPNGNLAIEGKRSIRINDEVQDITINGIARTLDITSDNTILSTFLADAQIKYKGNGVVGTVNRPGVIKRVSDWLF